MVWIVPSWSRTLAAITLRVQVSSAPKSTSGLRFQLTGPALTTAVCEPVAEQDNVNQPGDSVTASLKGTVMLAFAATLLAPLAGLVVNSVGAESVPELYTPFSVTPEYDV